MKEAVIVCQLDSLNAQLQLGSWQLFVKSERGDETNSNFEKGLIPSRDGLVIRIGRSVVHGPPTIGEQEVGRVINVCLDGVQTRKEEEDAAHAKGGYEATHRA